MMKYLTAVLLFAVAVFWPSVSARSVQGHYQEPHHGMSVENDATIEGYIQHFLNKADRISVASVRDEVSNIIHETKHKHWNSLDEFATYLNDAIDAYTNGLEERLSRNRRSVDSDSDESSDEHQELTADQYAKAFVLGMMVVVAPDQYETTLSEKFKELYFKEVSRDEAFFIEAQRIFKEVTGDDIGEYEEEWNNVWKKSLGDAAEE